MENLHSRATSNTRSTQMPPTGNTCSILDLGGSTAPPHSLPVGLPAPGWGVGGLEPLEALRRAVWPSESKWGVCPPLEPPVAQVPANCSNGEQVFDPTSPPHTLPEGLAVQDWVTPHLDPGMPSGGLYGALVEAQVRSHLPGEQQQRGVQPAPALDPGRPDHTGRKGVPPGGRWSVFVPAPVTNWRGRRACSGVSPRRARRCGSVGWRP